MKYLFILFLLLFPLLSRAQLPHYYVPYVGSLNIPIQNQPLADTLYTGMQNIGRKSFITPALPNIPLSIKRFYVRSRYDVNAATITGFVLKLGHTTLDQYYNTMWLPTDTVFTADTMHISISATTTNPWRWIGFELPIPFVYNGTDNFVWEIRRETISGDPVGLSSRAGYTPPPVLYGNIPYVIGVYPIQNTYLLQFGFDIDGVHDAALTGFVRPNDSLCSDINPIKVKVHNPGIPVMDSVRIYWTANGVPQPTFFYTTPIGGGETDTVQIGTYNFPNGVPVTIKAWTSHPNGLLDIFNTNDTIQKTFTATKDFVSNFNVGIGNDTSLCAGDTITLSAGSGTSTVVSFLWDNNSTNQTRQVSTGGTYYVTVSDSNSCERYDTIIITSYPVPIVDLGNDTAICEGEVVIFDAQNTGATYLWDDNSTNQLRYASNAQTYYVTVTDNIGCTGSDTVNVSHIPLPSGQITATLIQGLTYNFDILNPVNVTAANWKFGDGNTASGLFVTHTYNAIDTYNVSVLMYGVCNVEMSGNDEYQLIIGDTSTNSSNSIYNPQGIEIYPNPFDKGFTIKIAQDKGEVYNLKITDILGRELFNNNGTIQHLNTQLSTEPSNWQNGQYILQLKNEETGEVQIKKLAAIR